MNTSQLDPHKASKEKLLVLAEKVPGAWIGIKIATLLLVLEGQRPGWISEVLGQTRMNVNRWTRAVNKDGVEALIPKKQPGRPARMTPKIEAQFFMFCLVQHLVPTVPSTTTGTRQGEVVAEVLDASAGQRDDQNCSRKSVNNRTW